jgi:hypothetical protein
MYNPPPFARPPWPTNIITTELAIYQTVSVHIPGLTPNKNPVSHTFPTLLLKNIRIWFWGDIKYRPIFHNFHPLTTRNESIPPQAARSTAKKEKKAETIRHAALQVDSGLESPKSNSSRCAHHGSKRHDGKRHLGLCIPRLPGYGCGDGN